MSRTGKCSQEKASRIRGKFASRRVQTLRIRHSLIDAENKELYILGDVNCNLLTEASAYNSSHRTNIFDIYGLSQLITEPTRVTPPL